MTPPAPRGRRTASRLAATAALACALAILGADAPPSLPPIVFVSRHPVPGDPAAVPGIGPTHRAAAPGGRLLVRDAAGRIRPLLADGALWDVADPAVSWDGRRIAFAGTPHPDSGWRVYVVGRDGGAPRRVSPPGPARFDDLDPCWISNDAIVFASTREGHRAEYADVPVTNLYLVRADGLGLVRLTAERNGAEEPAWDPTTGRLLYARWWFNRFRPSASDPSGITTVAARAMRGDSVNLWQAVELVPKGGGLRLAAGAIGSRLGTMGYQPAVLPDGTRLGVYAENLGLSPRPGGLGIQSFPHRYGEALRLVGAIVADHAGDPYSAARGLAPPSACAPAALPDGRVVFAFDPGARGDYGVYVMRADGSRLERVVDLAGTLELDPEPLVARRLAHPGAAADFVAARLDTAATAGVPGGAGRFTYECVNVFAQGGVDTPVADAPHLAQALVLRVFAALARAGAAGGDTAVLLRVVPVRADGFVRVEDLPAGVPLFEQLASASGAPLATAHGAAHVAGFNAGSAGGTSRCAGCHLGHSILPAEARDGERLHWTNAAPSATASASSVAAGASADAVRDRRTRGPAEQVAWIAAERAGAWVRLQWPIAIEAREVVLDGVRGGAGTTLQVLGGSVTARRAGAQVATRRFGAVRTEGTRVDLGGVVVDEIEVRLDDVRGRVDGRDAAALAEVEVIGRPPRVR